MSSVPSYLIKLLKEKEADLTTKLNSNPIFIELNMVRESILSLNGFGSEAIHSENFSSTTNIVEYSPKLSNIKKAEYVLRVVNGELTCGNICDEIIKLEPNLNRKTLVSGMSAVLGDYAKNKNKIVKRRMKNGDWCYSLL